MKNSRSDGLVTLKFIAVLPALFGLHAVLIPLFRNSPPPPPVNIRVLWTYDAECLDVLETAVSPDGPWRDVPGPYPLTAGGKRYEIPVPHLDPAGFFRVRRWWGTPDIVNANP